MTAFAAIVWLADGRVDLDILAHVSGALRDLTGRPPAPTHLPGCSLLLAPLHRSDPSGPVEFRAGAAAGQVLLEDRDTLRHRLDLNDCADLSIVAHAYDRWQHDCARRLSGEYAFVVWDALRRELVAARDGLGIRLLYVVRTARALVASNVMAASCVDRLLAREIDDVACAAFLAHGGPLDPVRTAYRGIRLVPPGHTLRITPSDITLTRHWDFPWPAPMRTRRTETVLDGYRSVLSSAVRDRTRDVGTLFLSGGIDSGTIAACLTGIEEAARIQAVTATYDRFSTIDEWSYAKLTADATCLPVVRIAGDRHGALDAHREGSVTPEPLDEPALADWRTFLGVARSHGTAALYGEDGDAIFRPPGLSALHEAESASALAKAMVTFLIRQRRLPYLGLRLRERLRLHPSTVVAPPAWLTPEAIRILRPEPATVLGLNPVPATINLTRPDAQARLGIQISRDLAALAAPETSRQCVELRFPLLDTRVLRYVMSVAAIPWCQNKTLAREAFANCLPTAVLQRPKTGLHGFSEAIVADWRRRWRGPLPALPAPFDTWIDRSRCEHALNHGSAVEAMAAWRVFELDAWLTRHAIPQLPGAVRV